MNTLAARAVQGSAQLVATSLTASCDIVNHRGACCAANRRAKWGHRRAKDTPVRQLLISACSDDDEVRETLRPALTFAAPSVLSSHGDRSMSCLAPWLPRVKWTPSGLLDGLTFSGAIRTLQDKGIMVLDELLSAQEVENTQAEADHLLAAGALEDSEQSYRSDRMLFISEGECARRGFPCLSAAVRRLVAFARLLDSQTLSDGQRVLLRIPEQVMLAAYDGGGSRYLPHRDSKLKAVGSSIDEWRRACLDSPLVNNARYLTMVLYLNGPGWLAGDGGCLRCHLSGCDDKDACDEGCRGAPGTCHMDIPPLGGRLAVFFSRDLLHEVRPAWRRRWALTLWVEDARIPPRDPERYLMAFNRARDAAFVEELVRRQRQPAQ